MTIDYDANGYLFCSYHENVAWCEHLKRYIELGADKDTIKPSSTIRVPIFPTSNLWVEVQINEPFSPHVQSAAMEMIYDPDFGPRVVVPLGIWNPGEGRNSIRSVILDYIWSKADLRDRPVGNTPLNLPVYTKCPAKIHTPQAQTKMKTNESRNWKYVCVWNIVMEKACTTCYQESQGINDPDLQTLNQIQPKPWLRTY